MSSLLEALAGAGEGALVLAGPGAPRDLPDSLERRHLPAGVLVPLAEGARLADPGRPVIVIESAASLYGEGLGDLLHAAARNTGITCIALGQDGGMDAASLVMTAGAAYVGPSVEGALAASGFSLVQPEVAEGGGHPRESFESLVIGQSPLVTTVSTTEWDDWERMIYGEGWEEDDGGSDGNGAWT